MNKQKLDESNILLETIIEGVQEVKGKDMTILDLRNIETAVCKYFIICTGTSNIHVSSISDNVKKFVSKELNEKPWKTEGQNTAEWILMDYLILFYMFFKKNKGFLYIRRFVGRFSI